MVEPHRIEYKPELTRELGLEKEVSAFLNLPQGGVIYIGIDLEMVEHLGSGLPRITFAGSRPVHDDESPVTSQVTEQVHRFCMAVGQEVKGAKELMQLQNLKHRPSFLESYLNPTLQQRLLEMTQPNSPRSPTQKLRLTEQGKALLKQATSNTKDTPWS